MSIIKIKDLYFKPYIKEQQIHTIVNYLATAVKNDLPKNEVPLFIGILNGCFLFAVRFLLELILATAKSLL
jgi:hypothetical protein